MSPGVFGRLVNSSHHYFYLADKILKVFYFFFFLLTIWSCALLLVLSFSENEGGLSRISSNNWRKGSDSSWWWAHLLFLQWPLHGHDQVSRSSQWGFSFSPMGSMGFEWLPYVWRVSNLTLKDICLGQGFSAWTPLTYLARYHCCWWLSCALYDIRSIPGLHSRCQWQPSLPPPPVVIVTTQMSTDIAKWSPGENNFLKDYSWPCFNSAF